MKNSSFYFGEWEVNPASNAITCKEIQRQIEPRAMDVLVALCRNPNTVLSAEDLLRQCWGNVLHGDNPVYKTIAQLRRVLDDDANEPMYIQTIRKRGYRTVAAVVAGPEPEPNWQSGSPFRGLLSFDEAHASVFFGRGDATYRLRHALAAQVQAGFALQLVLGPSGSGKSSLVLAGLLPQLLREDASTPSTRICSAVSFDLGEMTEQDLFTSLASALLDWEVDDAALFPGTSAHLLGMRLLQNSAIVVAELAQNLLASEHTRCALFIDRLEALFVLPGITSDIRDAFLKTLETFARSKTVLVIAACRNDFYARIADAPVLMEGKERGAHFDLPPPTSTEIAQIIRWPARAAQLSFGAIPGTNLDLADVLCESAVHSPDALPLLQYTLQELYCLRSADGELGFDSFLQLGGIEGAIGKRAEGVVSSLSDAQRATLPHVLSLIVTIGIQEDSVTSQRAPWSALDTAAARSTVDAFVEARLLVSELVHGEAAFGVAHEAILRRWPRAVAWIEDHRDALRVRARCSTLCRRWLADGRPDDLLLPKGKLLDEAANLLTLAALSLSNDESDLIRASQRKARRSTRIRNGAIIAIVILALLAILLGLSAAMEKRVAEQRRAEAEGLMEFMLGDFADKLRPLGRLDLLDSVSAKALSYLSLAREDDAAGMTRRAKALQQLAEVQIARAAPQAAIKALLAARVILLQQQAALPQERHILMNLGANSFWLGQLRFDQSDWAAAETYFREYQQYSDRVHALEPDAVDAWMEQSYAHNSLGSLELRRGNARKAAAEFLISIELKQKARRKAPANPALLAELADSISWAATAEETSGQLAAATALYEQQRKMIADIVAGAPSDALWKYRWAVADQNLARLALAQGRDADALDALERSRELFNAVVKQEPENQIWSANRLFVELEIWRLKARTAPPSTVLQAMTALSERAEALHHMDPKRHEWTRQAALAQRYLAEALQRARRADAARATIHMAVQRLAELNGQNGADLYTREAWADALVAQADIERMLNAPHAVRDSCNSAREVLRADVPGNSDFRILDPWVRASLCLGLVAEAQESKTRLLHIGYRDAEYLHIVESH
ncbi:transcriptional regulator [Duganella rhizosphaerae]|uniref:nSTAND1 domain-containing NTPase n=1 Tax=Duganella rhizosphaerae TaxID=2885763 RepID=UPI0030E96DC4